MMGENPCDPVAKRMTHHTQDFRLIRRAISLDRSNNVGGEIDQRNALGRPRTRTDTTRLRSQNAKSGGGNYWRNFVEIGGTSRQRRKQDNARTPTFHQKFDLTFRCWNQFAFKC